MAPDARTGGARAFESLFARLRADNRGAFVPFVVLGDPDRETSLAILEAMARAGADALEVGLPFSDPVADGAAIQAASLRARAAGFRVEQGWELVARTRERHPDLPIGVLVYANLIHRPGTGAFYARAARAGVDAVLVADAPLCESEPFERAAASHDIAPVLIAPPNAADDRLASIAARSRGYVYVTTRPGVTGTREHLDTQASDVIRRLKDLGSAPPLLGFGVSKPAHVRKAVEMGASGAIAGSAIARIIGEEKHERASLLARIAEFVSGMRAAAST